MPSPARHTARSWSRIRWTRAYTSTLRRPCARRQLNRSDAQPACCVASKSHAFCSRTHTATRLAAEMAVGHFSRLIRQPEPAVSRRQQPQRSDQKKLQVLEERRALALDGVADELPDPGDGEDAERCDPQRPRQIREPVDDQ